MLQKRNPVNIFMNHSLRTTAAIITCATIISNLISAQAAAITDTDIVAIA